MVRVSVPGKALASGKELDPGRVSAPGKASAPGRVSALGRVSAPGKVSAPDRGPERAEAAWDGSDQTAIRTYQISLSHRGN